VPSQFDERISFLHLEETSWLKAFSKLNEICGFLIFKGFASSLDQRNNFLNTKKPFHFESTSSQTQAILTFPSLKEIISL